jgi:ABC-type multidrug transport system ATPase subunit
VAAGRCLRAARSVGLRQDTLLNIISGIVTPSHGKVLFDGKDITNATTRERNIAQVFQFPVIYDTMTVARIWRSRSRIAGWRAM